MFPQEAKTARLAMNQAIQESGERLKAAICAAEYLEAQKALLELSRAVSAAAESVAHGGDEAAEALREALEILVWAQRVVRAGLEHDRKALERVSAGQSYQSPIPRARSLEPLEG
jgi:thioesterase domain-containing protein